MSEKIEGQGLDVLTRLTLAWVRVYTAGLPGPIRERRFQQIRSDLWEHHAAWLDDGETLAVIRIEVVVRWLAGMLADIKLARRRGPFRAPEEESCDEGSTEGSESIQHEPFCGYAPRCPRDRRRCWGGGGWSLRAPGVRRCDDDDGRRHGGRTVVKRAAASPYWDWASSPYLWCCSGWRSSPFPSASPCSHSHTHALAARAGPASRPYSGHRLHVWPLLSG